MILKDKSRLYRLAHERIGLGTPSNDALKHLLHACAQELRLEFTWQDLGSELSYLAKEFLVFRESFVQSRPVPPSQEIPQELARRPANRFDFTPGALGRGLPIPPPHDVRNFNEFFGMWRGHSYQDLRREFRREFTGDSSIEQGRHTGVIDAEIIDALLRRLTAQPLDNPLHFVTDPNLGVLDASALNELYQRKTGA